MTLTRRTFTKLAFSSLLLPTWIFQRPIKIHHIDLSLFCGDTHRYDLQTPFWQAGMTYASDARVCVRTQLCECPADAGERRLPDASDRGWGWFHDVATGWKPLGGTRVKSPNWEPDCPACYGTGHVADGTVEKCRRCDGEKRVFDGEYEEDCSECSTGYIGRTKCKECGGAGRVNYEIRIAPGWHIAPAYLSKLQTLGEVQFSLPTTEHIAMLNEKQRLVGAPIMLRFGGGDGLLCGLSGRA